MGREEAAAAQHSRGMALQPRAFFPVEHLPPCCANPCSQLQSPAVRFLLAAVCTRAYT